MQRVTRDYAKTQKQANRQIWRLLFKSTVWLVLLGMLGSVIFLLWLKKKDWFSTWFADSNRVTQSVVVKSMRQTVEEPRFEFYKILSEPQKTAVQRSEPKKTEVERIQVVPEKKPDESVKPKGSYYWLQIAALKHQSEAKGLSAELNMLGFKSEVKLFEQQAVLWYRVGVGPFSTVKEMERVRARLKARGYQSIVRRS